MFRTLLLSVAISSVWPAAGANQYQPLSSNPEQLYTFGEHVYFSADDGIHGRELWRVDFDGNSELVSDLTPGPDGTAIDGFHQFKDRLYFRARPAGERGSLWETDGTERGTRKLVGATTFTSLSGLQVIIGGFGTRLIVSDGTKDLLGSLYAFDTESGGIQPLAAAPDGTPLRVGQFHGVFLDEAIYFSASSEAKSFGVWRTDGTEAGTVEIHAMDTLPVAYAALDDHRFIFSGNSAAYGNEPWISAGTRETTKLLKDLYPGSQSSDPGDTTSLFAGTEACRVYFAATDPEFGRELWQSDGTPDGTRRLTDLMPGTADSNPYRFIEMDHWVYFTALGEGRGNEWWRFDTRTGEIHRILDINPGLSGSDPYAACPIPTHGIYFSARDERHGEELWFIAADSGKASLVADLYPGPEYSEPYYSVALKNHVVTAATSPVYGRELWILNGAGGLDLLADIFTDASTNPSSYPHDMTPAGKLLFFVANDIETGNELWCSDGTPEGTELVKDIFQGTASSEPAELTAVGDLLYFTAEDGVHGFELWRSDGTGTGTALVLDIHPDGSARPRNLTAFGDRLIFSAYNPHEGEEPWILEPGRQPRILANIASGDRSSAPDEFTVWRDRVFFQADDGVRGRELWCTDGTEAGTRLFRDIVEAPYESLSMRASQVFGDRLVLSADIAGTGVELWSLEGEGPTVRLLRDIAVSDSFGVLNTGVVLTPSGVTAP